MSKKTTNSEQLKNNETESVKSKISSSKQNTTLTSSPSLVSNNDLKKAVEVINPKPFVEIPHHGEHRRAVSCVSFAPTKSRSPFQNRVICASGSSDGTVKIWEVTPAMIADAPSILPVHNPTIHSPSPNNNSDENIISTHSSSNNNNSSNSHMNNNSKVMSALTMLVGHSRGINDLAWSTVTSEYIATASDDKTLRLWCAATGDALVEFRGHTNFVFSLAFNPQSNLLVSGSFDETVKIWDVRTGTCLSTIPAHSDPVTSVQFNRDGTLIASASHDGLIRVWDCATGECLKTIYADGNPPVSHVKFTPNSKYLLSSTLDSKLRLWDILHDQQQHHSTPKSFTQKPSKQPRLQRPSGAKCIKTFSSHVNTKYCAFSALTLSNPLRQGILCGSEDNNAYLYDLQNRRVLQVLRGHTDAVLAVAAHDKKEILCTGGMTNDKTVKFWVPARTD